MQQPQLTDIIGNTDVHNLDNEERQALIARLDKALITHKSSDKRRHVIFETLALLDPQNTVYVMMAQQLRENTRTPCANAEPHLVATSWEEHRDLAPILRPHQH